VSHFVAEFANTTSSLAMVFAGLCGIYLHPWAEKRFHLAFLATVSLGLGSVAFHGTLYKFAQALDEVPMLYCVFTFTFITLCQRYKLSAGWRSLLATALILHAIITTILVTLSEGPLQFALFHVSFNTAHFYALYETFRLNQRRTKLIKERHSSEKKLTKKESSFTSRENLRKKYEQDPCLKAFELGSLFYGLAIGCWLVDMFLCEFLNPVYSSSVLPLNPQLHAWWHVFISVGLYYMSLLLLADRMEYLTGFGSTELRYAYHLIPYIATTHKLGSSSETSPLLN
jgi:dihydroceramidase